MQRRRRSTAPCCIAPFTPRSHEPSPRSDNPIALPHVPHVPYLLLLQLPTPSLRPDLLSRDGYAFSSNVNLPLLSARRAAAAPAPPAPSSGWPRRAAALDISPLGVITRRNRFSKPRQPTAASLLVDLSGLREADARGTVAKPLSDAVVAGLGPLAAAPPPSKAHWHGQRHSQHQRMHHRTRGYAASLAASLCRDHWKIVVEVVQQKRFALQKNNLRTRARGGSLRPRDGYTYTRAMRGAQGRARAAASTCGMCSARSASHPSAAPSSRPSPRTAAW